MQFPISIFHRDSVSRIQFCVSLLFYPFFVFLSICLYIINGFDISINMSLFSTMCRLLSISVYKNTFVLALYPISQYLTQTYTNLHTIVSPEGIIHIWSQYFIDFEFKLCVLHVRGRDFFIIPDAWCFIFSTVTKVDLSKLNQQFFF